MISSDNIRGHLEAIVLLLVREKDRYGYEISKEIINRTQNVFQIKQATLYAVFQRLEKRALITSYYGDETQGGRRKYYKITAVGRAYYKQKVKEWNTMKKIINIFMEEEV